MLLLNVDVEITVAGGVTIGEDIVVAVDVEITVAGPVVVAIAEDIGVAVAGGDSINFAG